MYDQSQIEKTATIVVHSLGLKFEVINQTRDELLTIREAIQNNSRVGTVLILLPNNKTL